MPKINNLKQKIWGYAERLGTGLALSIAVEKLKDPVMKLGDKVLGKFAEMQGRKNAAELDDLEGVDKTPPTVAGPVVDIPPVITPPTVVDGPVEAKFK